MSLKAQNIVDIPITVSSKQEILEETLQYLQKSQNQREKSLVILTPNPEIITHTLSSATFKKIVVSAQINIPDGVGVVWALEKMYGLKIPRLTGVDLFKDLCSLSEKQGFRIGLLGGSPGVALKVSECLRSDHPKLEVVVLDSPEIKIVSGSTYQVLSMKNKKEEIPTTKYLILNTQGSQVEKTDNYFKNLVSDIQKEQIDILFVALGFPKQELFINEIKNQISKIREGKRLVLMAVGGTFDYVAGIIPRAPIWMQKRGLEWLYRLVREPSRLGRQIRGAEFFIRVFLKSSPRRRGSP